MPMCSSLWQGQLATALAGRPVNLDIASGPVDSQLSEPRSGGRARRSQTAALISSRVRSETETGNVGNDQREPEPTLVERALSAPMGRACLTRVLESLIKDLRRNRFSSAKAVRAYTSGIDKAVWDYLQGSSLRRIIYRNHLIGLERFLIVQAVQEVAAKLTSGEFARDDRTSGLPQEEVTWGVSHERFPAETSEDPRMFAP
jgi:hypothetical protein